MNFKFIPFLLLILCSCSFMSTSEVESKSKEISYPNLSSPWTKIDNDKSDIAFLNSSDSSVIYVNSICKKYQSSSLKSLFLDLTGSSNQMTILEQNYSSYQNREALVTLSKIKVDGINTFFNSILFKKNRCLYDFVLISNSRKTLNTHSKTLINFLKKTSIK